MLTPTERWEVVLRSAREVGPALFFSLLIITVSFLPVFSREAQEGRLFKPLAWTKTLTMASASLLSVTMVPVTMGLFIKGRIHREHESPIASAVGGMSITRTVEGRERYSVRVRYPQELRDQPQKLAEVLVPIGDRSAAMADMVTTATMAGVDAGAAGPGVMDAGMEGGSGTMGVAQIPLGQVARIRSVGGPMAVKTEQAFPTAWVFIDVAQGDLGSYVAAAREMVDQMVELPPGYTMQWSGQYEYMQRAKERLQLVVPATLLIIFSCCT